MGLGTGSGNGIGERDDGIGTRDGTEYIYILCHLLNGP